MERYYSWKAKIQSISLKGEGIHRTVIPLRTEVRGSGSHDPVIPLQEEEIGYSEYYLASRDFAANGIFCFFGLPVGEYELIIDAEGYQQYSERYFVKPGDYKNTLHIELEKKIVD